MGASCQKIKFLSRNSSQHSLITLLSFLAQQIKSFPSPLFTLKQNRLGIIGQLMTQLGQDNFSLLNFFSKRRKSEGVSGFRILNSEGLDHCPDKSGKPRNIFGKSNYLFFILIFLKFCLVFFVVMLFLESNMMSDKET